MEDERRILHQTPRWITFNDLPPLKMERKELFRFKPVFKLDFDLQMEVDKFKPYFDRAVVVLRDHTIIYLHYEKDRVDGRGNHGKDLFYDELTEIPRISRLQDVSFGKDHLLLVTIYGDLFSMGSNEHGQLGSGEISQTVSNEKLILLNTVKAVQCGDNHNLVLLHDGKLKTWGCNSHGQLGHGHYETRAKPEYVAALEHLKMKLIAASGNHSVAVSDEGRVYAWGENFNQQHYYKKGYNSLKLPMPILVDIQDKRVKAISCRGYQTLMLTEEGEMMLTNKDNSGPQLIVAPNKVTFDRIMLVALDTGLAWDHEKLYWFGETAMGDWNEMPILSGGPLPNVLGVQLGQQYSSSMIRIIPEATDDDDDWM